MNKEPYLQNLKRINNFILNIVKNRNYAQLRRIALFGINHLLRPDNPESPLMAVIGITNRCNLKCGICPRHTFSENAKTAEMSFEDFKYIVDQLSFVNTISISGLGEPFMHKDLLKMIRYVRAKNIFASVTSNGTLLTDKTIHGLVDARLNIISFSLDASDKEKYEDGRRGACFEETINNIKALIDLNNRMKANMDIKINMTASTENYGEIPAFVYFANKLGIKVVEVAEIRSSVNNGQFLPSGLQLSSSNDKDNIKKVFKLASEKARSYGINLTLPRIDQVTKWTSCLRPWYSSFITIEGDVRQCCASTLVYGNVFEEKIKDIWQNERFVTLRKRLRANPPPYCLKCPLL